MTSSELGGAEIKKTPLPVSQIAGEGFRRYMFSAFSGNVVLPIFSLFVPLLALRLGASVFEIGLVGGASNAVYSFMPFITGRFSDRKQLGKLFIISSFVLLTVVSISYILIAQPVYLIVARVFEGIGWAMLWPALTAEIGKNLEPAEAKRVFSIYNITWSGAAALGPLLGSALIFFTSIQYAFLGTVFILLVSASVNIYPILVKGRAAIEGKYPASSKLVHPKTIQAAGQHQLASGNPPLGLAFYMTSCTLSAVASGVLFTFFAPYARFIGLSILAVGGITFVFGLGRFLTYVLTVNESVRHVLLRNDRRVTNMIIALSFTTATSLVMLLRDPSGISYFIAYALSGAGMSIVYGISQAGMIAEAPKANYGRNAGMFESSIGLGASTGPILAGAISGNSIFLPFIVPFLGLILYLVLLPLITRRAR